MENINSEYLKKCLDTLKLSYEELKKTETGTVHYEMFHNSLVKGFEMTIEQSAKLLKKRLSPYFATKKAIDILTFKDLFREAHKHSLIEELTVKRWFEYRDNRNNTAHDYGQTFEEQTLILIDDFIVDVENLLKVIECE
ncbi:MAG: nucleotidyltransferase substrate binding protein [Candidatus Gastranaerophilales bacterium]